MDFIACFSGNFNDYSSVLNALFQVTRSVHIYKHLYSMVVTFRPITLQYIAWT